MRQYIGTPLRFEDVRMHVNCNDHKSRNVAWLNDELQRMQKEAALPSCVVPQPFSCQKVHSGAEDQNGDLWTQSISPTDQEFMFFKYTEWNTKGVWRKWNIFYVHISVHHKYVYLDDQRDAVLSSLGSKTNKDCLELHLVGLLKS